MNRIKYINMVFLILIGMILLTACGKNEDEAKGVEKENQPEKTEEAEKPEEETDDKETAVELDDAMDDEEETDQTISIFAPQDQGDKNVWFDGEIKIDNKTANVKGTTNLLPDSRVQLRFTWNEGAVIGSDAQTNVDENGEFELDATFPEGIEGVMHVEVLFNPLYQSPEIRKHYEDNVEGKFVRLYKDATQTLKKASFKHSFLLMDDVQTIGITEPDWEAPTDYAEPTVRIESEVEVLKDYFIIHVQSNLIEETFIQVNSDVPGYITNAFDGNGYTNPDGTAEIYIKHPDNSDKFKGLKEFAVNMRVDPTDTRNGPHVTEVYGENGEKLKGNLTKKESNGTYIIEKRIDMNLE